MAPPLALVIEDDTALASIFEIVLKEESYQVESIYHGQTAFDRLDDVIPDLILLDLYLPGVSGNTILKKIRSDDRFSATRVIIVTASSRIAGQHTSTLATTVLEKPVNLAHLRLLIKRF